ncbi:uncharacterized protein TRIADDRAFT_55083 [Trichoplax adhaerens]|uniref:Uncharacterized protein n=1 Tax=Trichoplax adhaerens TaxID=10228 RepID=B3RQR1_TRIAD|nr:hypothetical protein TRIADDRAFT_55083 [Trichoplax adhaerens]EDV26744.1 hypothetical protein TRIADDRAFT_55083 [Trichoplax adhaerens]|eukprot:XP_002110740.1 hypothetical protein TRIADDRAFT_55083 [Trichoplax adhaerens]
MIWRGSLMTVVFCLLLPGYYAQEYYEFTTHPSNVYLAGGVPQVVMSCRAAPVTGLTWTYQWRLNNDYLSAQQRGNARFTGFNSNELTIGSATSDIYDTTLFGKGNNFTCVATNNNGPITSRIANIFRVGKPFFQGNSKLNKEATFLAGQATSIQCGDTKFPEIPITLLWHYTRNELRFNPSSDGRIAIALDGTLYFANLLVSDATRYRCGVRPTQPITSTNIFFSGNTTLAIQPRVCTGQLCDFGPELHKRSGNVQAVIGSSITLECIPKGRPTPIISWCLYNSNTQLCNNIQASSKYAYSQASNRLTINNLIPQDAGTYRCIAKSIKSIQWDNVLQVDPKLTWITRFRSMSASIEDTVTFPCTAYGTPPLKYTWYKQAIKFPLTNSRFIMSSTSGNLTIRNLLSNDTGVYQCVVEDRYNRIASGGYFEVKVFAARFTETMQQQQIIQVGPSAQVVCPIDGGPKPTIDYFFNGNQISLLGSNKYERLRNGNLLVKNVVLADGGNYTCRGRNRYNPVNTYVTGWARAHVYQATKILEGPTTRSYRIGSTVTIPCNVTADSRIRNAVTVVWQRNGQSIQASSKYVLRNLYPNYALTINNAQIAESGNYSCRMTVDVAQLPGKTITDTKIGNIAFNAVPLPPTLASGRLVNSSMLFLNWTFATDNENNSPLKKFVVQFRSNYISTIRTLLEIPNINQRSTFITPSPYITYTLYVAAENGVGLSQRSNQLQIRNPNTAVPTDAPTNLYTLVNSADLTTLTVYWTPLTGEQANGPNLRYLLRYRKSNTANSYKTIDVTGSSYTISGLEARVNYDFDLRARNDIGPSAVFAYYLGCTCEQRPVGIPFNVTVVVTNANIVINWLQVPVHLQGGKITANRVRLTQVTSGTQNTILINSTTSITLYGLAPNTNYTVAISGRNAAGEGPFSVPKTFRTGSIDTAYKPVLGFPISSDITNDTVTLRWTIVGQPFYFQPQYRLSNTIGQQVRPFYQEAWFIIIIVIACLALIIAIAVLLCKGRKKAAVPKGKQNPPIPPPPETTNEEYDTIKRPPLPHPQTETIHHGDESLLDNNSIDSLEQYADLPGLSKFNEDGSFIGEYGDKEMDRYSQYNHEGVIEPTGSQYGAVRDDASYHTNHTNHKTLDVDNSTTFSTFV